MLALPVRREQQGRKGILAPPERKALPARQAAPEQRERLVLLAFKGKWEGPDNQGQIQRVRPARPGLRVSLARKANREILARQVSLLKRVLAARLARPARSVRKARSVNLGPRGHAPPSVA